MNEHDETNEDGRLSRREIAFAARDAVVYLEALWTGDSDRAGLLYGAADEREREAIAQALASIALTALRTPEGTPPGRFVGIIRSMLEDGLDAIDGAGS
ncbi:hypothetical protein DEU31_1896 [Brachybacterium sp. AG952]|uniref:hypothetical protein n=1 Tax=Brachybacterium sp. AG952 TaxID=2183989 RepID=UPI0010617C7A|nr:hypothetical protein [Brachybacterium sp. AG952]TDP78442.1 hypothetical protein DEU31_1896 [Brachybacterium sp. AG952]